MVGLDSSQGQIQHAAPGPNIRYAVAPAGEGQHGDRPQAATLYWHLAVVVALGGWPKQAITHAAGQPARAPCLPRPTIFAYMTSTHIRPMDWIPWTEATGLAGQSVDLVVAAQCLHW